MSMSKNAAILLTCCIAHNGLAGDRKPHEKTTRLLLPAHLFIDDDKPASEAGIDYAIYKVGNAHWPDWDWSDPTIIRREQKLKRHKKVREWLENSKNDTTIQVAPGSSIQISAKEPEPAPSEIQSIFSMIAPIACLLVILRSMR